MPNNTTPIDLWLHHGQKVRIKSDKPYLDGKEGIIAQFYWVTGEYLVWVKNGTNGLPIPLSPSEVKPYN